MKRPHSSAAGRPHVCWVHPDIGFYHHARIDSYASSGQGRVTIVEVSDTSRFQQFKRACTGAETYQTATLFQGRHYEQIDRPELLSAVNGTLEELQPDVLVVQGWGLCYSLAALDWALGKGVPVVLTSESARQDEPRKCYREWSKSRVVRLCSSALVGGRAHAAYMAELGMPHERIFFGYDVVENNHFWEAESARRRDPELRAAYGLPERYFLASARFVEKKNLTRLLQAYARFRELSANRAEPCGGDKGEPGVRERASCPWSLVLLGDGLARESLTQLRSVLGLEKEVHMPGFKAYQELPVFYGLAGAFIHASTTEQWGLVVSEAMASGLPVVVSKHCGCTGDVLREGANGFTFDPYDIEDMAHAMLRVASMEDASREKLGQESRRIISAWGPERFASGLQAAVQCALSARPKPPCLLDRLLLQVLLRR